MLYLLIPLDICILSSATISDHQLADEIGKEIHKKYSVEKAQSILQSIMIKLDNLHDECHILLKQNTENGSIFLQVTDDLSIGDREISLQALAVIKYLGKKADYHTRYLRELSGKYPEIQSEYQIADHLPTSKILQWIQKSEKEKPQRNTELSDAATLITEQELKSWQTTKIGFGGTSTCYSLCNNKIYKKIDSTIVTLLGFPTINEFGKINRLPYSELNASYLKNSESVLITPDFFIIEVSDNSTKQKNIYKVKGGELARRWTKNQLANPNNSLQITGLIMQKAPGQDLVGSTLSLLDILYIYKTVLNACLELKKRNFIYWDIKMDNVIYDPISHIFSIIDTGFLLKGQYSSDKTKTIMIARLKMFLKNTLQVCQLSSEEQAKISYLDELKLIISNFIAHNNDVDDLTTYTQIKNIVDKIQEIETKYHQSSSTTTQSPELAIELSVLPVRIMPVNTHINQHTQETYFEFWTEYGIARRVILGLLTCLTLGMIWIIIAINWQKNIEEHSS